MTRVTARNSTIFIATGEMTRVYRSIAEVPLDLRRKLHACTRGMNSATILIADKRGREELVRALQGRPTEVRCRLADNMRAREQEESSKAVRRIPASLRTWLELLLPVAIGASLWLVIGSRL